jgi:hypothetical protein
MMVCTRERPAMLEDWLRSVAKITVPDGIKDRVVVADNTEVGIRSQVEEAAAQLGLDLVYTHEPSRGYTMARNAAIEAVLSTDAQLLIFTDDDLVVEPDLVAAYLACFEDFEADVIHGARTTTKTIGREGRLIRRVQTYNVGFRRWLVDGEGLQLRFDPWFNLLGSEDIDFFDHATAGGAIIRRSLRPRVGGGKAPESAGQSKKSKAAYHIAICRNAVYIARARRGNVAALRVFLANYLRRGPQGVLGRAGFWLSKPFARRLSERFERESNRDLAMFKGGLQGLVLPGLDRPLAKDGLLVRIPDPGPPTTHPAGALRPAARSGASFT